MLRIQFANAVMHGRPVVFSSALQSGLYVGKDGFAGWDDAGEYRRDSNDRPSSHGAFDAPAYLNARAVTISGYAVAQSPTELRSLRDVVMGAGADGGLTRLTVQHQDLVTYADARRTSATFSDAGLRDSTWLYAKFEIQVVCPDPRRYGETRTYTGDDLRVFHRGNFPAPLEFVVPNGPANWQVGAGARTVYVRGMTAGGEHRLDMRTGRLYRNDELQFGKVSGDVWSLAPGTPTMHSISGAGSFEVRTVDTYV